MRMRPCLLLLAVVLVGVGTRAQNGPPDGKVRHEAISADLSNALARVASIYRLPIIAELAQPLPKIRLAEGTDDPKLLLQEMARQAPGYDWRASGRVILFYNKKLREAKFNFLNLRFPRFSMPANLSELKLIFPELEGGLLQGYAGAGVVVTGFGDALLAKDLLQPATLQNVSGREILLRAATESPTFLTIVVFPNAEPTKKQVERDIGRNWFWQALKEERPGPIYVEPPLTDAR
jgi:hypothetical protein